MEISWCNLAPSNPKSLFSWPWKKVHGFFSTFSWDFHEKEICSETRYNTLKSSLNSSLRSSHIWFSYIQNFIIILSRVYNEPIQRPAPSWLVSLIGRALHRYRRGQGFESRTSLNFFQAFFSPFLFCPYLGVSNTPYLGSDVKVLHLLLVVWGRVIQCV